jgi:hypothetical protein
MKTYNVILKLGFIALIGSILISSCENKEAYLNNPNTYTSQFQIISTTTIPSIQEFRSYIGHTPGSIGAISYHYDSNEVMIVLLDSGILETWSLDTYQLLSLYELGIVTNQGLEFDGLGNKIIGAIINEFRDENNDGNLEEYIKAIKVWNTRSGEIQYCLVTCDLSDISSDYISAGINLPGDWIYSYDEGRVWSENINTGSVYGVVLLSPEYYFHNVGRITFNSSGMRYAIAYQEGGVRILSRKSHTAWLSPEFEKNIDNDFKSVSALTFSLNDKWLARIRENKVTIWRVFGLTGKEQYEVEIPSAKLLVFDNTEQMLFVSSEDIVTAIDITKKEIVTTLTTTNITALAISQDNRLLLWGDSVGGIHVWGIKQ